MSDRRDTGQTGQWLGHNVYLWAVKRIVPDTDIMALLPVQERDPVLQQSFSHMVDEPQQRELSGTRQNSAASSLVIAASPDWMAENTMVVRSPLASFMTMDLT